MGALRIKAQPGERREECEPWEGGQGGTAVASAVLPCGAGAVPLALGSVGWGGLAVPPWDAVLYWE